jgi:hypothetical protein
MLRRNHNRMVEERQRTICSKKRGDRKTVRVRNSRKKPSGVCSKKPNG